MRRRHPPFVLAGGEIVVAILLVRIALWLARGWRDARRTPPPEPDGPGGLPLPAPLVVLEGGARGGHVAARPEPALQRAA